MDPDTDTDTAQREAREQAVRRLAQAISALGAVTVERSNPFGGLGSGDRFAPTIRIPVVPAQQAEAVVLAMEASLRNPEAVNTVLHSFGSLVPAFEALLESLGFRGAI